jgi:hypothetical protein
LYSLQDRLKENETNQLTDEKTNRF